MQQSNKINDYIKTVCQQIRWKKAHNQVSEEIEAHITDQKNAFINDGLDEEIATEKAIVEMGDPVLIGTELDRAYRPKFEWSIFALTCIMTLIGLLIRIFALNSVIIEHIELSVFNDITNIVIGLVAMVTAYFLDFTAIGKYPKKIFFGLIALIIVLLNLANRQSYISFVILLFPMAFAGLIYGMRNRSYLGIIQICLISSIPAIIGISIPSISSVLIYSISCLILLTMAILNGWFNVKKSSAIMLVYGAAAIISIIIILIVIISRPYIIGRLQALFNPLSDKQGFGWMINSTRNILSGAKLIGQGSLGEYGNKALPSVHSDFLLTCLINNFGWISFIGIMAVAIVFIYRLAILCKKQKSILAKLVSTSILSTFIMQIVLYVAFDLGFQLFSPLTFPFISYGGTSIVINMFMIGIMLSIFNLGDLMRDNRSLKKIKNRNFIEYLDGKIIIDLNTK